jgi:SAM-dependent methyltransferase
MHEPLNKTMHRGDLETQAGLRICSQLDTLLAELDDADLAPSSWYGELGDPPGPGSAEWHNRGVDYTPLPRAFDDTRWPWFLYWQIAWIAQHAGFEPGQRVLDLGGSGSLFACYLARLGLEVTAIDLQPELVARGDQIARAMGWTMTHRTQDIREVTAERPFDHVTSICVYEHIATEDRVEINRHLADLLAPGGRFSITFDYANPSRLARIGSPDDVREQFITPAGLAVRGNETFCDNGKRYLLHPFYHHRARPRYRLDEVLRGHFRPWSLLRKKTANDYTIGSLFLEKP